METNSETSHDLELTDEQMERVAGGDDRQSMPRAGKETGGSEQTD